MSGPWLSSRTSLVLAAVAVAAFHVACDVEAAAALVVIYLGCLFLLARVKSPRWAFYLGLGIGFAIAAGLLRFFLGIFGWGCIGLWAIFGIWIAFFLLLSRIVVGRWPRYGVLWLPVIWLALEYTRSELYYLRFGWLTPGLTLSHPGMVWFAAAGVYGFSFAVLSAVAAAQMALQHQRAAVVTCFIPALFLFAIGDSTESARDSGPLVMGIQLESPSESEVLEALDAAISASPDADLFVLSEYCFDGPVPPAVCNWCAQQERHLIAGGKENLEGVNFIDTVFVISPAGEVIFQQGKMVPIQFFNDGLPAREQKVWESPWGKIGMAICYDLSYSRVIDHLIAAGAQALIIPAMDAEDWGEHEHRLHAKVAPVRAREYGVPIFRLASSGISQIVDRHGRVVASAPFPGRQERLTGRLAIGNHGLLPPDRYLALPAVTAVGGLLIYLAANAVSHRLRRSQ